MFDETEENKPKSIALLLAKKVMDRTPKEDEGEEMKDEFNAGEAIVEDIYAAVKEGDKDLFRSALDSYIELKLSERD